MVPSCSSDTLSIELYHYFIAKKAISAMNNLELTNEILPDAMIFILS